MLGQAHDVFAQHWSARSLDEHRAVVKRAAMLMGERCEEMARSVTLEMGKLIAFHDLARSSS